MNKIVMLGYSNKLDFVVSLAKTLKTMEKKVLVIDGTTDGKYKYAMPSIEDSKSYITYFDGVDYAVGFEGFNNIEQYMFEQNINLEDYDYMIIDIETSAKYEFFKTTEISKYYFVFDTNMITYAKNLELFNTIKIYSGDMSKIKIKRILYRAYLTRTAEDYFDNKFKEFGFEFDGDPIEIYEDERDKMQELDFLISGMVNFKKHTRDYINTVAMVAEGILEDYHINTIKRAMKKGGMQ